MTPNDSHGIVTSDVGITNTPAAHGANYQICA